MGANARDSFSHSATGILGPIVGAFLVGLFGYTAVFVVNGTSFLLSAISEMFIRFPKVERKPRQVSAMADFSANFREGLSFIWTNQGIRTLVFFGVFLNFLMNPLFSVFFPFFGKEVLNLDAELFGWVQSGFPIGMLFGTLIVGLMTARFSKSTLLSGSIVLEGLLLTVLSMTGLPFVYTSLSAMGLTLALFIPMILMGVLNVQVNVPLHVLLQEMVPENFRGRVFGMLGSMLQVFTPISMAVVGVLVDIIPAYFLLVICGTVVASLGFAMGASKAIRQLYTEKTAQ